MPAEKRLQLVAAGTKERLKIRGNVEVYCCYGISSPMVLGLFHKWIVLPVRDFSPESLQIVLTHEFVAHPDVEMCGQSAGRFILV